MRRHWRRLIAFFAVLGPGFVTASAGNDVGGIQTYSLAGAQFGYATLWTLVALTVSLIVVQEMAGRMGAVTGQGLAGLIRENFGLRITFLTMVGLFLRQYRDHGDRVRRHRGRGRDLPRLALPGHPARDGGGLFARAAAAQQDRRTRLRRLLADLPDLHRLGRAGAPRLARGRARRVRAAHRAAAGLPAHGGRADRHDDLALHAVLLAVAGRRQGLARARPAGDPRRHHRRLGARASCWPAS